MKWAVPSRRVFVAAGALMVLAAVLDSHEGSTAPTNGQTSALLGQTRISRPYPPEAGLRLLEDILSRIRSSPQLAMARQNLRMQSDELAQSNTGPTDYRLAIKPREVSKPMGGAETSDLIQDQATNAGGGGGRLGIWESSEAARGKIASLPETISPSSHADDKGLWEKEKDSKQQGLSEESTRRLSQPLFGLFNATNKMAQAQRMANIAAAPAAQSYQGGYGGQAVAGGSAAVRGALQKARPASNYSPPAARAASAPAQNLRDSFSRDSENEIKPAAKKTARKAQSKRYEVALLPPNVVTGIPLLRLGCSETEAGGALSSIGTVSKSKINGWTIWSYQRDSKPVLQVYVKHGQVEAVRVFDSSLLSPELGVRLGDDLSVVKERFGEPAFMLSEPLPGVGQNYIYPLSQVGFLFTRPSPFAPPAVAGLLIFNVKW